MAYTVFAWDAVSWDSYGLRAFETFAGSITLCDEAHGGGCWYYVDGEPNDLGYLAIYCGQYQLPQPKQVSEVTLDNGEVVSLDAIRPDDDGAWVNVSFVGTPKPSPNPIERLWAKSVVIAAGVDRRMHALVFDPDRQPRDLELFRAARDSWANRSAFLPAVQDESGVGPIIADGRNTDRICFE